MSGGACVCMSECVLASDRERERERERERKRERLGQTITYARV